MPEEVTHPDTRRSRPQLPSGASLHCKEITLVKEVSEEVILVKEVNEEVTLVKEVSEEVILVKEVIEEVI